MLEFLMVIEPGWRSRGRLALTYLVPILPLLILWDGVVSSLRTYAPVDGQPGHRL